MFIWLILYSNAPVILRLMDNNRHLISSEELQLIYSEKSRYIRLAIGYIQNEKEAEDIF